VDCFLTHSVVVVVVAAADVVVLIIIIVIIINKWSKQFDKSRITVAHGRFNRIRQEAPMCTRN